MDERQQFSTFQSYLKDRESRIKRSLSAIEKRGVEGALDRCRMLADQINRDLRDKEFGRTVNNISSLAELWSAPFGMDRCEAVQMATRRASSSSNLTGLLNPSAEWRRLAL
jgi:predicted transcriptional regulator